MQQSVQTPVCRQVKGGGVSSHGVANWRGREEEVRRSSLKHSLVDLRRTATSYSANRRRCIKEVL